MQQNSDLKKMESLGMIVRQMQRHLRESTMDFHLLLHWLSCWAYCFSTFALSTKQATISLQAWKDCSVRCTVRA